MRRARGLGADGVGAAAVGEELGEEEVGVEVLRHRPLDLVVPLLPLLLKAWHIAQYQLHMEEL